MVGLAVLVSCGPSGGAPVVTAMSITADEADRVVDELCTAQGAAGDEAEVSVAFAEAHGPLHELARVLSERDRPVAAELLEAKQQVESALKGSAPAELRERIDRLVVTTRDGLDVLGISTSPCDAQ